VLDSEAKENFPKFGKLCKKLKGQAFKRDFEIGVTEY
jgi:hypothetical protein